MRNLTLCCLTLLAAPVFAAEPSYNFVQLGYQRVDLDIAPGLDVDGDGFALGGSVELNDSFHAFAGFGSADFDFSVDLDEWQIGAGYRWALSESADVIVSAAFVQAEVSALGFSVDEDGFALALGFRSYVSEELEFAGSVSYVDFGNDGDDTSVGGAARYHLSPALALEVNAGFGEDTSSFGVGVRYYFGR